MGGKKVCLNGPGTWPRWLSCPYSVNALQIIFFKTSKLITFKLGIHYRGLRSYNVCSNDDPNLTLIYFMARSNLLANAFVWENS